MSSLTNLGYTATQYALLSSNLCLAGKDLEGDFPALRSKSLSATHGLVHAYGIFFIVCGLTGCACGPSVRGIGVTGRGGKTTGASRCLGKSLLVTRSLRSTRKAR